MDTTLVSSSLDSVDSATLRPKYSYEDAELERKLWKLYMFEIKVWWDFLKNLSPYKFWFHSIVASVRWQFQIVCYTSVWLLKMYSFDIFIQLQTS